ncbi:hypothetical protein [Anaplasma platys]|uniref:hypothetical protein n=1 Tax=Anaplasma platys TaxID=949 RepID=UPI00145F825C|nr:hypothetical protein [Anaplasma platys]
MKFSCALFFFSALTLFCLSGCITVFSKGDRRIKSPCVRASSGYTEKCERHSVNDWWLNK